MFKNKIKKVYKRNESIGKATLKCTEDLCLAQGDKYGLWYGMSTI